MVLGLRSVSWREAWVPSLDHGKLTKVGGSAGAGGPAVGTETRLGHGSVLPGEPSHTQAFRGITVKQGQSCSASSPQSRRHKLGWRETESFCSTWTIP